MGAGDLDLNLLRTLHVLLAERHVSRAAVVLGRSQPAVSNALRRLRAALGDEILVRGADGLVLTPRAKEIQGSLQEVMALVRGSIFGGDEFDPATATGIFRISTPDRLTLAVVPSLFEKIRRLAPQMRLDVMTADRSRAVDLLNDDQVDIALGWLDDMPPYLKAEFLTDESLHCVMRRGHPLLKPPRARFSMEAILSFPHLVVSATSDRTQIFDDLLANHKLRRNALVTLTNFTAVPPLLKRSDMIGVFTELASDVFAKSYGLATRAVPLDIGKIVTNMVWHARNEHNKRHMWFRQQIKLVYRNYV